MPEMQKKSSKTWQLRNWNRQLFVHFPRNKRETILFYQKIAVDLLYFKSIHSCIPVPTKQDKNIFSPTDAEQQKNQKSNMSYLTTLNLRL